MEDHPLVWDCRDGSLYLVSAMAVAGRSVCIMFPARLGNPSSGGTIA